MMVMVNRDELLERLNGMKIQEMDRLELISALKAMINTGIQVLNGWNQLVKPVELSEVDRKVLLVYVESLKAILELIVKVSGSFVGNLQPGVPKEPVESTKNSMEESIS